MCDRCLEGFAFFGLAEPQLPMLDSYAAVLRTGWSPNNMTDVSAEQLAEIVSDPKGFLERLTDPGGIVTLADGTHVPRIPFRLRWMWDGEFCGVISLRYQPGTDALPPHVAGHAGYAVVPWKRRHGYASRALRQMLDEARAVGLSRIVITMQADNAASRAVVERNGGVNAGFWSHPAVTGADRLDRYVIAL